MKSYPLVRNLPLVVDDEPAAALPGRDTFVGLKSSDRAAREEILHRAYAIWESEGHPSDRKLANWLQAEAEVMSHT